ncbi:zf-HC2 domain-containing protein [bacterium]|nr:zf-HC2 domain-containing protein [bacterium]
MDCKGFRKGLGVYLEGELSPDSKAAFEKHLEECSSCRALLNEFTALWRDLEAFERIKPSPYFKTRVKGRIKEILVSEGAHPSWAETLFTKLKPAMMGMIVVIGIFMGYLVGKHIYEQNHYQYQYSSRESSLDQFINSHYIFTFNEIPDASLKNLYFSTNHNQ